MRWIEDVINSRGQMLMLPVLNNAMTKTRYVPQARKRVAKKWQKLPRTRPALNKRMYPVFNGDCPKCGADVRWQNYGYADGSLSDRYVCFNCCWSGLVDQRTDQILTEESATITFWETFEGDCPWCGDEVWYLGKAWDPEEDRLADHYFCECCGWDGYVNKASKWCVVRKAGQA